MKTKHYFTFAVIASSLLTLVSCGRGAGEKKLFEQLEDTSPITEAKLYGSWSSGCIATISENALGIRARLMTLSYQKNGLYIVEEFTYSDLNCRTRVLKNYGQGTFRLAQSGRVLTQTLGTQFVIPLRQENIAAMNQAKVCGVDAWRLEVARDILSTKCVEKKVIESDAGIRETGELVMNVCLPRISSSDQCEFLFFAKN